MSVMWSGDPAFLSFLGERLPTIAAQLSQEGHLYVCFASGETWTLRRIWGGDYELMGDPPVDDLAIDRDLPLAQIEQELCAFLRDGETA